MKIITNGHNPAADQHIQGVVKAIYDEVYPIVERALAGGPYAFNGNPWDTYLGTLEIVTHPAYWTTGEGTPEKATHAGLTHWFPQNMDSKIEFAWDNGPAEMFHEWPHWLGLQAGHPYWGDFAHGTENDPIMQMLRREVGKIYFENYKIIHAAAPPQDT